MDIIPVIDLMDGQVVHAKHGNRDKYLPIQSTLCASSAPDDVIACLQQLYPFKRLYIADINAIQGNGNHINIIQNIRKEQPDIEIWLDAGINDANQASDLLKSGIKPVLGSESLTEIDTYLAIHKSLNGNFVLSLDSKGDCNLGPKELFENCTLWPKQVIVMTLDRVGSGEGPTIEKLESMQTEYSQIYAAGGVRHVDDLMDLSRNGIHGALIASVIHNGMIGRDELKLLSDI